MLNKMFPDNTAKLIIFFKVFQKKVFFLKYIYIFANCNTNRLEYNN